MKIQSGDYALQFRDGGVEVYRGSALLYQNRRPMYAFIKTVLSITEFYDAPYEVVEVDGRQVVARGVLRSPTGSQLAFRDSYEAAGTGFKISRTVTVLKNADDYGFATKVSFVLLASDEVRDYDVFAPANWYRQNEYAKPHVMGYDKDCEYFWRREVNYTLPMFAAQHRGTGEMAMLSRWAADITMRDHDFVQSEHIVDRKFTIGAIGLSKPESRTLNYLYYGYPLRKEIPTTRAGLSIDYVYPGVDGQMPRVDRGYNIDYMMNTKTMTRIFHPMEEGFTHGYAVGVNFGRFDGFYPMMRDAWRTVYARLKDAVYPVDQELQYRNCMESLTKLTRQYGDSWGLPFSCQLPQMDVSSVSFQFGFVGQQPGIGYQLIRYGDKENRPESFQKGLNIIEFWVRTAMTEFGAPQVCYNPTIPGFEPMPFWTRLIADGLENILDAYVYMKKKGKDYPSWLDFCRKAADWFVRVQNGDGSWYRAYNTSDGSLRMDSKANTISAVRFLIQMHLVTGGGGYREAALKAGEWAYQNTYRLMEYRGSTCDNSDIMDNESGIYAMFGFLSLYDLTGEQKWLEALIGAADYTETWTYCWSFPVRVPWPNHPFTRNAISGQSPVTLGGGGGDMYMAACAYIYYRLYVITEDEHYRDYAEFIHNNTRQANDVDGSFGYALPGLSHEGGRFADQTFLSHYHWLPWVTYVEVDPTSRLYDTFGAYDIAGAERLSPQERRIRNRIYDSYL
ncbi:MAG: hypothetical protein GX171_10280 [Clostridiales bacterium]|jgi:hypothetical protein|nr:hypothetical protein [Clostridiales bacterium]